VAGFLFNGGIAGYQFLDTHKFLDYQGTSHVSWKSIPLTMFVTQRGLLYAIPAGLLLLWQWRSKYGSEAQKEKQPLPVWTEFFLFWLFNFGPFLPLIIALVWIVAQQESDRPRSGKFELSIDAAYLAAAVLIFLLSLCVKTAPWEWDNIKLLIWSYFITLPIL